MISASPGKAYLDEIRFTLERASLHLSRIWPSGELGGSNELVVNGNNRVWMHFQINNYSSFPVDFYIKMRVRRWTGDEQDTAMTGWFRKPATCTYSLSAGAQNSYGVWDDSMGAGAYSFDVRLYDRYGALKCSWVASPWSIRNHAYAGRFYRTFDQADPHASNDWPADDIWHNPSDEDILYEAARSVDHAHRHDIAGANVDLMGRVNDLIQYQTGRTGICAQHTWCDPGDQTSDIDNLHGAHENADGRILGDCNDYADLHIGLARAMHIPSRRLTLVFFEGAGTDDILGYGEDWFDNGRHAAAETLVNNQWRSVDPTWDFVDDDDRWFRSGWVDNGNGNGHVAVMFARSIAALSNWDMWSGTTLDPSTRNWGDRTWRYDPSPTPWAESE